METWKRRALGILALGGGFLGIVMILTKYISGQAGIGFVVVSIPFLVLYAWGIWCGIAILEDHPDALRLNQWFWAIQIPVFLTPYFSYIFYAGGAIILSWSITNTRFGAIAQFGSQFQLHINNGDETAFGINILAVLVVGFIYRFAKRSAP